MPSGRSILLGILPTRGKENALKVKNRHKLNSVTVRLVKKGIKYGTLTEISV